MRRKKTGMAMAKLIVLPANAITFISPSKYTKEKENKKQKSYC